MTVQSAALVADLKALVLRLEDDLRERVQSQPEVLAAWQDEHRRAAAAERTASTWQAWRDDRVTQAAVAWVLTTVFVRFCEDNALLRPVWISGPPARRQEALDAEAAYFRAHPEDTHREWLLQAVEHLRRTPATAALVDERWALWTVSPSGRAATELLTFWRERAEGGELVRDFADPAHDSRFLGDLYQDLSEHAKKTYALLQTPDFVEEFILDRTLEPALAERPLEGFRMIDPACGSGHFLLGAFARLLDRWQRHAPGLEPRLRVQKALDSVWGVDLNPFAVAIARFRLLLAALDAVGAASLEGAPGFDVHALAGDSLWFSHDQDTLFRITDDFAYSTEHKDSLVKALTRGQYDAVVANPPYITVKDPKLNLGYRDRYNYVSGRYALTVPFMELLFKLARSETESRPAGWVGQITSNSFMKREFGKKLIEEYLSNLDVSLLVDTSGAYIPGHGTPTLILVGRSRPANLSPIRVILGKRGEPTKPADPLQGLVWSSIVHHLDDPGFDNAWITVANWNRSALASHPVSMSGGGADQLKGQIERGAIERLGSIAVSVGFTAITGADDLFTASRPFPKSWQRDELQSKSFVRGEDVRDFGATSELRVIYPYGGTNLEDSETFWPYRSTLRPASAFGRTREETGKRWFEYILPNWARLNAQKLVSFSHVATHNHFALVHSGVVCNQHAPVIMLESPGEDEYLAMLGVLNSSTACFWLRENSHDKGRPGAEAAGADEPWERRFEFTGSTVQDFPLPRARPLERARTMDSLARHSSTQQMPELTATLTPTAELLASAELTQASLRGRMIAHQEELDWEVYASYGLIDEAVVFVGEPPEIRSEERAFAIVLARAAESGEVETSWFEHWNHRFELVTEIPAHWTADYRDLVQRRIDAIESVDAIRLLETPEYKRRWTSEPFAAQAEKALRNWLLDRMEARDLWFSRLGHPTPRSVAQLADELGRDAEFVSVVELWRGKGVRLVDALGVLLEPEAVPCLAAYRLKDTGLRKFADWQRTWELQRQEDAMRRADDAPEGEKKAANARADKFAATIPVPPKYTSTDFRKSSYWSARGKLDVPKERFIAYPGAGRATDPTALLGWAGWDHAQQSLALATIIAAREADGAPDEVLVPLVAGMAELQPWVQQWHSEVDPAFGQSPAEFTGQELARRARQVGRSLEHLAAWRPPAATRGRRAKA